MLWWVAALVLGAAPRALWPRFDSRFPFRRAAFAAGLLAFGVGVAIGIPGFLTFAQQLAGNNNDWMLHRLAAPPERGDAAVGLVPYGVSILTLFIYFFATPSGLLATYLMTTGTIRGVAAYINPDDARGDFILSGIYWILTTTVANARGRRARRAREREEGVDVPDVLVTGDALGIAADVVVIAARQKAEWRAGAIVMTGTDWYKLASPVDTRLNGRLRTLYPLTKMDSTEVVRRGIYYELPRLSRRITQS
ncbi:MAG TPA: hypothetical protein VFA59_02920 [Vicinamibacterales bacterium]|nr:hypothetical protein [Vicinamibacterales bacterium]